MRGSHDEQIRYLEDKLNIKIRSHYDGWGGFMEIFERRNLIAHGNYIVNSHYVKNCNKHGLEVGEDQVGERLLLEEGYLRRSSERLLEFGMSLIFVLWLKHFEDSQEAAYMSFNHHILELIKDGQSRVAAKLLELALFKQTSNSSERVQKIMTINLANAYKKLDDDDKAQKVIAAVDWSAATNDFQICIAAIKGDIEGFVELMPLVAQGKLIDKSEFREWPVFDWVREERSVREAFQELFGEPITNPADEERSDQPENRREKEETSSQTVR